MSTYNPNVAMQITGGKSSGIAPVATAPVGVKAKSPTTSAVAPSNKLATAQVAPRDLSATYGIKDGTVYNKNSQTKFSTAGDFFKDSGLSSFNNLKFDTTYNPTGKETVYGMPSVPLSTPVAPTPLPTQANQTTPAPLTGPYTPPNQGTNGVSQGGIIGNLIGIANKETPQVTQARANLQGLTEDYGNQNADILSRPEGLTQQTGQQGILASLFANKQQAAQTALDSALTSQGQQITATNNAGQLNAPIIANPGQVQINPSQATPGATTSGAANLNSLIGQRTLPGQTQVEFYNTSTGQGFSSPEELAAFVNQQIPGANATAQNVFSILQSSGQGGTNVLGFTPQLIQQYAQLAASGQLGAIPADVQSNPVIWSQVLNAANAISPGFNYNVAAGSGAATQQNIINSGTAASDAAHQGAVITGTAGAHSVSDLTQQSSALKAAFGGADANFKLLINTAKQGGVNDTNVPALNTLQQNVQRGLTSNSAVINFQSTLREVRSQYANILGGGTATESSRQAANEQIPDNISLGALQSLYTNMTSAAQNRIRGIDQQISTLQQSGGTGAGVGVNSNGSLYNF